MRRRLPPDVARVLADYRDLGEAARRGLHMAERLARRELEEAVVRAQRLARRVR